MSIAEDAVVLKEIARLGALHGLVEMSTIQLAKVLGTSQQTASRRIRELEKFGFLRREMGVRRQLIRITDEGLNVLTNEYADYKRLLEHPDRLQIRGRVTSGLGEGRYYLAQPGYINQFVSKLGFTPYPGTLNVDLEGQELNKLRILKSSNPIQIEEFRNEDRTFGAVDAWRADLDQVACAIILPRRTHHTRTMEVVAADYLRQRLRLSDGDEVEARIYLRGA